jgi:uncharacterized damage-inducible protein DinB
MSIADTILPEFDQEMAKTRSYLERVPDGNFDWVPHPKSMKLGRLATHLAEFPNWASNILTKTELDIAGPDSTGAHVLPSRAEVLKHFEAGLKEARGVLANAKDADWSVSWSLKAGPHVLWSLPRIAVFRGFVFSHMIHHRGQLSVYLRLNNVALPPLYGPTADQT